MNPFLLSSVFLSVAVEEDELEEDSVDGTDNE
jgi:hypothetical protein